MTQTTISHDDWTALRDEIRAFLGDWPHRCARDLPALDALHADLAALPLFADLDKAGYLARVREYKTMIRRLEAVSRTLKAERRTRDIWVQAAAQERLAWLRTAITVAIHQRRLGKAWSRAEKAAQLSPAA